MDADDRQAIQNLFAKLGEVERQAGARDAEAEALIRQQVTSQPGAPYYMAQTILMQEYAMTMAEQRIAELERDLAERPAAGGGFLSGLFGGGRAEPAPRQYSGLPAPGGHGHQPMMPPGAAPGRGSGFLAGAAQTAMGVAGGMLLGNVIAGAFSSGDATAADAAPTTDPSLEQDAALEAEGYDDTGDEEL
jgi:hypothetical protein